MLKGKSETTEEAVDGEEFSERKGILLAKDREAGGWCMGRSRQG